ARRDARHDAEGRMVPLDQQDRSRWRPAEIAKGVAILQAALSRQTEDRPAGRYQIEAAIAALHDDAPRAEETDWPQILQWYDELLALETSPCAHPAAALARAVAA